MATVAWPSRDGSVFLDLETNGCQFGGDERLRVTVGVVYVRRTGCMYSYLEDELGFMAFLLDCADSIIIHNKSFDLEVLRLYFGGSAVGNARVDAWDAKIVDLFEIIRLNEGSWVGLNALCEVNGRAQKTGSGLHAVELWNDGRVAELISYCAMDVILMVRLLEGANSLWFCQKRYNIDTHEQEHQGTCRMNTDTFVITPVAARYPPGFHVGDCPCVVSHKRPAEAPPVP
jgi:hypothetical protein